MTKTAIQQTLDENIPKDVIAHRAQSGKELSYLETWYVIDRMNQVFGQGNWGYSIVDLKCVFEGKIEQYSGEAFGTSYIAQVQLDVSVEGRRVFFTEVGYGDGTDKKSPGKAHELATKEAVSDAVKRACKNLGRSMGLALYDKTQEYVGTPDVSVDKQQPISKADAVSKQSGASGGDVGTPKQRPVKELVAAAFKSLEASGQITAADFKTKYLGGVGLSKIPVAKLETVYETVCKDFNL
jgi:DNA recombination protein Rad52